MNMEISKEEFEKRINTVLIISTLLLNLILLGSIIKLLLALSGPIESEPLIFKRGMLMKK
jgi:hypothetical protein